LVFGGVHVSTPQVYAYCTPQSPESFRDNLNELAGIPGADEMRSALRNGLESGVFAVSAHMRALYERVERAAGRPMRISGAGSVLFDVFDTAEQAEAFVRELQSHGITQEIRVVRAPVSE
ncbi:MAG TPA: hypothetical protein P5572_22365, partial [Phycisphaerae bacterium]|nr:hypothetical protein [Phycisphaerae bacterium]